MTWRYSYTRHAAARAIRLSSAGFTVIELLVAITVMLIITSVVLYDHQAQSDQLHLRHSADMLSLKLRQAQTYGLGVRQADDSSLSGDDRFEAGYGVHIDAGTGREFITFQDLPGSNNPNESDGAGYHPEDSSAGNEHRGTTVFEGDVEISKICIGLSDAPRNLPSPLSSVSSSPCGSEWSSGWSLSGGTLEDVVDVVFQRPRPDASFYLPECSSCYTARGHEYITELRVYLESPEGRQSVIVVTDEGAVSLQ